MIPLVWYFKNRRKHSCVLDCLNCMTINRNKVILVRAEIPGRIKEMFLPNNILVLAEALLKAGREPILIDMKVQDYANVIKDIDWSEILCVGISTLTGTQITFGLDFARTVRDQEKSIPIVWGGPHPSLCPEETIDHPLVDIVVRGEGEKTLVELCDRFSKNEKWGDVAGITYKEDGTVHSTPDRDWVNMDDMDALPYHLLDFTKYTTSTAFSYHSSRGCPHKCAFCINHAFHKSCFRYQSAEKLADSVEYILKKFNAETIHFTDDNFFVNKNRIHAFCEEIKKRNLKFTWNTTCRFDYFSRFDKDFLKMLRDCGCKELGYGAESGSQRILDYIEKGITPNQVLGSIKSSLDVDIILSPISFMYGFPTETVEDLNKTLDLIDNIRSIGRGKTVVNGMFLLTPYPGTPLADELKKKGYTFPKKLEEWSSYLMSAGIKNISWLDKKYLKRATVASHMIRFRYFMDINAKRKLQSGFLRFAYALFVLPFLISEKIRWKNRVFDFAPEWTFWAFVRTKFLKVT